MLKKTLAAIVVASFAVLAGATGAHASPPVEYKLNETWSMKLTPATECSDANGNDLPGNRCADITVFMPFGIPDSEGSYDPAVRVYADTYDATGKHIDVQYPETTSGVLDDGQTYAELSQFTLENLPYGQLTLKFEVQVDGYYSCYRTCTWIDGSDDTRSFVFNWNGTPTRAGVHMYSATKSASETWTLDRSATVKVKRTATAKATATYKSHGHKYKASATAKASSTKSATRSATATVKLTRSATATGYTQADANDKAATKAEKAAWDDSYDAAAAKAKSSAKTKATTAAKASATKAAKASATKAAKAKALKAAKAKAKSAKH
ncbi:hypothetical protein IC607_11145 [Cellulomonas sp. JH27-2]|uniref:hypothetical protein n=1 Tax=Cellulomonas sp. JH27-2 TaxID=2774139 RepID=UPI0017800B4A|nr:hypothetical protein [Cellulomonas sp. JH27-2]MBD8059521.1 hypothetical protein [Cellulomonas sp. JH27-2]